MERVHQEFKDQGLVVLAINLGEDRQMLGSWVKGRNVTSTVLHLESAALGRSYAITATPTVFLVDRSGKLVGKAVGTRPWTSDKGRALLRELLAR
jgi:thioredoxin-related protein